MKIVELIIDMLDELTGVNAVALVEQPAIESDFLAFKDQIDDFIIEQIIRQEFESMTDKHFEDLDESVLDEILLSLKAVGKTEEQLKQEGYKFNVTSGDANPTERTTEQIGNLKYLYKYTGPRDSKNRSFCRQLLDLNLLFRKEDISKLTMKSANGDFGFYDIFTYKGSHNCRHEWTKVLVTQNENRGGTDSITEVENFSKTLSVTENTSRFKFSFDEDKQIVVGPAMVPNKLILRVDENGDPYYVYFSNETIRQISDKIFKTGMMNELNLEHQQDHKVNGYLMESWIIEDEVYDKSRKYGLDLPVGTLMTMYKIEDLQVWNKIKQGEIKGFSVEGHFADRLVQG